MSAKQEAIKTIDTLPETATWDDVIYTLYVKQKIYAGLQDILDGKITTHEEAIKRLITYAH